MHSFNPATGCWLPAMAFLLSTEMEGGEPVLEFNATLLAQIADFIILLIFLRLVAYKPLMKLLNEAFGEHRKEHCRRRKRKTAGRTTQGRV